MSGIALTPETVIRAYMAGIFPMAANRNESGVHWVAPRRRGIMPLDAFHIPRRLAKTVRQRRFRITADRAFTKVIERCAEPRPGHPETWINDTIISVFTDLHELGLAHSVETWQEDRLVGGTYGLSLGGAFFGESMFSRITDASKVALVALVALLRRGGYTLLDIQFINKHLHQFGAVEITAKAYLERLSAALGAAATFYSDVPEEEVLSVVDTLLVQSRTQTS